MELQCGKPQDVGISPARLEKIIQRANAWVKDGIHHGLVILAARKGVIFLHEAIGRIGLDDESPVIKLDTIFPIASLTKPFTATATMILVEEGLLGLNRPVVDYIPELNGEGKSRILVRHLLTHSSGLNGDDVLEQAKSEMPDLDEPSLYRWLTENLDKYIALIAKTPLREAPDTIMMYAGANFELLGELIKRVSGKNLAEFANERVFNPLEMNDSFFIVPEEIHDRIVHRPATALFGDAARFLKRVPSGNVGLYTTAMDAAIFGQMFLNQGIYAGSKILSPASIRAMTRDQLPGMGARFREDEFPTAGWGLGWSIGGVFLWVDPVFDMVGVYFSVVYTLEQNQYYGCADLFINMVQASVEEI
jgi:CubicO group peptidase (beta-lactamase class C family)